MNVLLNYINDEGDIKKLSIDMTLFHIEEYDGYCLLIDKAYPEIEYQVLHAIQYLHMLANGFNTQILN